MAISREVREAYEQGLADGEHAREHPTAYALAGSQPNRPYDPELAAAYDKGFEGEPLDVDDD